jgi:hypothetical protein
MNPYKFTDTDRIARLFYPAIMRGRFVSPIDALVSLGVPADEARDLVLASWSTSGAGSIAASTYGGRSVAVLPLPDGRWAACNVFLDARCATQQEAERRLARLLKPGTRGSASVLALRADELSLVLVVRHIVERS